MLKPMKTRSQLKKTFSTKTEEMLWNSLIEKPIGHHIESRLKNDALRGMALTDAKIGVFTNAFDPSLIQNQTFLYHIIGGAWNVPEGGMIGLVNSLASQVKKHGGQIVTNSPVEYIDPSKPYSTVYFQKDGKQYSVGARFVLVNAAPLHLRKMLPTIPLPMRKELEGSVFKINMVLNKLPLFKSGVPAEDAMCGTFQMNEEYSELEKTYQSAKKGIVPDRVAGELYCHTLTDPSIVAPKLRKMGYHTLTLFGLDMPYHLFVSDNDSMRKTVLSKYLKQMNKYLSTPIEKCLAKDSKGKLCIEAKTPVDLQNDVGLPFGNIFHTSLSWPFLEDDEPYRKWGVEIGYDNIFLCGSGAYRGGAVSGIPGHNAAKKVLELL